jgi:hypothetical protein
VAGPGGKRTVVGVAGQVVVPAVALLARACR